MTIQNANAVANELLVSAMPCTVYQIRGHIGIGALGWIHVFDYSGTPINGLTPVVRQLSQGGDFVIDFGTNGRPFANGCAVAFSSTFEPSTLIGASNQQTYFDVQFQ